MECEIFETFLKGLPSGNPTIQCVFMKIAKESIQTYYHSFSYLSGKFSHSKTFNFFSFLSLSLSPVRSKKSIKDYFDVARLEIHGPNYADDNPRQLKKTIRCPSDVVSTRIFLRNLLLTNRYTYFFQCLDKP